MESYAFDSEENYTKKETYGDDSTEENDDFMAGFESEDEVEECTECGAAIRKEKRIVKTINGEEYTFCSQECVKEFEESIASE